MIYGHSKTCNIVKHSIDMAYMLSTVKYVASIIYLGAAALQHIFDICRYNVGIQVMAVLVVGINVFTTGFV